MSEISRPMSMLAVLLIRHRYRAQLSQEELAERAQISARALRNIELGKTRYPHARTIHLIAEGLELDSAERETLLSHVKRPLKRVEGVPEIIPAIRPGRFEVQDAI
ncbi:helix-turn-helix domain-containing protein [Nocardia terpenica]|uniref:helix-turn-helix domain-containing protein n=1 Tax=Nocardia terpenica TaxID=455432 RepID=UPI000ACFB22A|nr:helix-turn-helix transcriptional regulator [Nocardia terpenica]NQE93824.1 helix-turn-helix domain-containing protein [Nocardia terpenica]